uniref:Homeobox protein cut-like n=1 Tax=Megaselia scalaris TaxID=36166 RepID=T1GSG3_MEGSC
MRDMRLRQIQELQATLDEKCQHIELLESRLEKQKNEQIKTDNISVSVKLESEPEKEEHNTSCPSPKHSNENSENFSLQQPYQPQHFPPQQHIFSGLHLPFQDRSPFRFSENGSLKLSTSLIPKADPMEAKLQEILRYNMDKYINQELDTKLLSLRVRELLSVHNIGQRHFAKYVLGLSQGTVSELLSKPKCWEKLTEKGRDSLGKCMQSYMSPYGRQDENDQYLKCDDTQGTRDDCKSPTLTPSSSPIFKNDSASPEDQISLQQNSGIPDENLFLALKAYQLELMKLHQSQASNENFPSIPNINFSGLFALQHQMMNGGHELSLPKPDFKYEGNTSECEENILPRQYKSESSSPTPSLSKSQIPSPNTSLNQSILPPSTTPTDFSSASAANPLQRMASITNSLLTQPIQAPHQPHQNRPNKAVLPPITQQQFDMYSNLNTEDIVSRIKEALSQYSISQRLFGESIVGLSQGSVSDLLARPKPWHMLTQKGREPFIRMQMFLDDENAVHKLVANQYKIAPEKLMRTGNYGGTPGIPQSMMSKSTSAMAAAAAGYLPVTPPIPRHMNPMMNGANIPSAKPTLPTKEDQSSSTVRQNISTPSHISHSVYEMAALTQDLDTQVITTKIKEALLANNIGQKIFGEAVLGLSQGSVSELLSKPKPWHMLSIKGREPFIRMHLWLSDVNNIERIQNLKQERREATKRSRSLDINQDNQSDTSSTDTNDFYTTSPGPGSVSSNGTPASKKQRVLFSPEQKEALKIAFSLDPYPNVGTIEFLANELELSTRTVTNWFHNHRMRSKQQVLHGGQQNEAVPSRENTTNPPLDPLQFRLLLNHKILEMQKERFGLGNTNTLPMPFRPISGLDLSLAHPKENNTESEMYSDNESLNDADEKNDNKSVASNSSSNRRKVTPPQWVNPYAKTPTGNELSEATDYSFKTSVKVEKVDEFKNYENGNESSPEC